MPAGCWGDCLGPRVQRSSASPVPPHVPAAGSLLLWMVAQGTGERCLRQGCGVWGFFYFILLCLAENGRSTVPILWFSCLFSYIL